MQKFLFLTLFLSSLASANTQNELTLHFIPSPEGMDWSSPSSIAKSALMNRISFKPRFIGHVFVEMKCGDKHELTGMTGKNFDYLNQLLVEQRGLGILYHSFVGGLEDKEKILPELNGFQEEGYSNFVTFLLNDKQCERTSKYLTEYRNKNVGRHYGLANRPRHGEGAGCTAFGISFIDVLGFLDQEMKDSWSQTINIPLEYAGPPLTDKKVNLLTLIFNASSWAQENEKHQKLTFWDPDKMHSWVQEKVKNKEGSYKVVKLKGTQGIVIDKSHFPAPENPIWLQQIDPKNPKTTAENTK